MTVVEVNYRDGEPESYLLPLTFIFGERATELSQSSPQAVVARLKTRRGEEVVDGILFDALYDRIFLGVLLDAVSRRRSFHGKSSEIAASPSKIFRKLRGSPDTIRNRTL